MDAALGIPLEFRDNHEVDDFLSFLTAVALGAFVTSCSTPAPDTTSSTPKHTPTEWIDKDTGHRVVRLSRELGSESLYFNVNSFTPDGKKMAFTTTNGISMINLATWKIEPLVEGQHLRIILVGHKTGAVFYSQYKNIFAADPETKAIRKLCTVERGAHVSAVNADETLLAGTVTTMTAEQQKEEDEREKSLASNSDSERKSKAGNIQERFDKRFPMELFFLNIQTGEMKKCNSCNDWLNHLLFSPTDPNHFSCSKTPCRGLHALPIQGDSDQFKPLLGGAGWLWVLISRFGSRSQSLLTSAPTILRSAARNVSKALFCGVVAK